MTLLVIVVLVMLVSLSAYRYTFVMESEYRLTRLQEELVQARLCALSGVEFAAHLLDKPMSQRPTKTGSDSRERMFRRTTNRETSVPDVQKNRMPEWQFGLLSPNPDTAVSSDRAVASTGTGSMSNPEDAIAWRWGMENESAKLSIPAMLQWEQSRPGHFRSVLLSFPGMDEETADAWLDQLGVLRARGAIGSTSDSSSISNSNRFAARDEADAARDRVRILWYGGDLNQNYRLDPIEVQLLEKLSRADSGFSQGRSVATMNTQRLQPLQRYLTWVSGERNERKDGRPRIYLNHPNLQQLHQQLTAIVPTEVANFVIAYRQYGPSGSGQAIGASPTASKASIDSNSPSPAKSASSGAKVADILVAPSEFVPQWNVPGRFMIQSPSELFGAAVELPQTTSPSANIPSAPASAATKSASAAKKVLRSPFSSDRNESRNYLGSWLADTTVLETPVREGRVDITDAPVEVLMGIPGIDEMLAQRMVQQRRSIAANPEAMDSIAWLLEGGVVDIQKLREIEPFLTHRSDVYTVQSIGFRDNRSPVYRCTVTIDARQIPARPLDLKVWHTWDRGFDIDTLTDLPR